MNNSFLAPLIMGLLLASSGCSLAQAPARSLPGYVVTMRGDTLRGALVVPRFATDEGIRLFMAGQAVGQRLRVGEVRAFGLADGRRFVRCTLAVGRNVTTGVVDSAAVFLQQLVAGKANFYRYDVDVNRHRAELGVDQGETVQYYIAQAGGSLALVRRRTYQVALPAVLEGCPAVAAAVPHTVFDEDRLAALVLRYNTECQPVPLARDYRPAQKPSPARLLWSLRVGAQQGTLFYSESASLPKAAAQARTQPSYSLELRLAENGQWSVGAGIQYARLRSEAQEVRPAQFGTTNAGEPLTFPVKVQVQSWQVPLLLRYTLGHQLWRPYLAAGALVGVYRNNQTSLSYSRFTYVPSAAAYFRESVATQMATVTNHATVGGTVRLGVQFKTTARLSPLLEAQYSAGSDFERNQGVFQSMGNLRYQTWGLVAGLEF